MKRALKIALPLLVLVLAVVAMKAILASAPEVERQAIESRAPLVRTALVRTADRAFSVTSHGTVRPRTESALLPEVPGRIVWVSERFVDGGFFEEGDELLRLDRRDHELAVIRAEAAVARADLSVAVEESEAAVALREWAAIGQGEAGALVLRVPQLAEARARAAAARADLAQAELDLERTAIRAPFDGRVRERRADLGESVTSQTRLGTIYATDRAEVVLPVRDEELAYLDVPLRDHEGPGVPVTLSAHYAGRDWLWQGRIVRTGGFIDPATRLVDVIAVVDDPYAVGDVPGQPPLAVGMFVEATLEGRLVEDVVVVPRSAVHAGDMVLVVDAGGRLESRPVDVLRTERERVVIGGGLADGDRICLSILETATDGMAVRHADEPLFPGSDVISNEALR